MSIGSFSIVHNLYGMLVQGSSAVCMQESALHPIVLRGQRLLWFSWSLYPRS